MIVQFELLDKEYVLVKNTAGKTIDNLRKLTSSTS